MRIQTKIMVTVLMGVITAVGLSTTQGPPAEPMALVIVDIQDFYFAGGSLPLVGSLEAAHVAQRVLRHFRDKGWPVIHVQHLPDGINSPGQDVQPAAFRIRPEVAPRSGEVVIGKHYANAFRDTRLLEELEKLGTRRLVIIGMQTHMCLEAAVRAAADLGFQVTVIGDACATRDLEYGGVKVPAAQVHASTLASLAGAYATVVSADEFLKASD